MFTCFLFDISIRIVPFFKFFTELGFTTEDITLLTRNGDNLVSGTSSLDSNNMNLGKIPQLALDQNLTPYGVFSMDFFYLYPYNDYVSLTVLSLSPTSGNPKREAHYS